MSRQSSFTLAQQIGAAWVILDDLAARHVAEALGLPVMGTLGVLLQTKEAGHIPRAKPLLDKLHERSLYFTEALYASVLGSAGEYD